MLKGHPPPGRGAKTRGKVTVAEGAEKKTLGLCCEFVMKMYEEIKMTHPPVGAIVTDWFSKSLA